MIKNKDGSTFRLSHPNPIMVSQNLWKDKVIVYNNFGKKAIFDKDLNPIREEIKEVFVPQIAFAEPTVEAKPIDTTQFKDNVVKTEVWCLPGKLEEVIDPLYGDKHIKKVYGEKFVFEAIIDSQNDFSISLFSSVEISIGSIIFPRNQDKKWWEVRDLYKEDNLYKIIGEFSTFQPHF